MPSRSRPDADAAGSGAAAAVPPATSPVLRFLGGYPPDLLQQVQSLVDAGRLGEVLRQRYPERHAVRTDKALYDYVMDLKARHLRGADPLSKVAWDSKLQVIQHALGTHTRISRVQGGQLKAKRELRVATVFRQGPPEFLRMIVVHELAHLRQREHDKAFYALCTHMEPAYHQFEFDTRLWLTARQLGQWADD